MTEDKFWEEMEEFQLHNSKLKLLPKTLNLYDFCDSLEDELGSMNFNFSQPKLKERLSIKEVTKPDKTVEYLF